MGNANAHGSRWSREFHFYNEGITKTGGKPSPVTKSFQVPSPADLKSVKPDAVGQLANMEIKWRQWGVGVTKLQGSPFSEISFGFGRQSDMEGMMCEAPDACEAEEPADDEAMAMDEEMMEEGEGGEQSEKSSDGNDGYMFKKDITWQDREFNFEDEQKIDFDSSDIYKIQYTVKRYQQAPFDCCEVNLDFLGQEHEVIASLKSHDVPEDSVVQSYTSTYYKEDIEVLKESEMIIGAKINQDYKGANCSIQFLIAELDPAKRKKGMCG